MTAGASALAGCAALGEGGDSPETVTATEPNDDGEGTLGELRYLVETEQGDGDLAIELTRMVTGTEGGESYVRAEYDSDATDLNEFVDEVGAFASSYAIYVDAGGEAVENFRVVVNDRYSGQPTSFGIRREWARSYNSGEASANDYLNKIARTFAYPTTTSDGSTNDSNTSTNGTNG